MPQTHSRRRKRRRSWPRTVLLLVFVFAALAAVYRILIHKPQLAAGSSQLSTSVQAGQAAASAGPVSAGSVDPGPDRYARKDDFFTILVSGMDNDNGGSDTNILVAFDAGENAVHCVSIPRDSGVYYNGTEGQRPLQNQRPDAGGHPGGHTGHPGGFHRPGGSQGLCEAGGRHRRRGLLRSGKYGL